MIPASAAISSTRLAWLMPSSYMMSNSACLNGGATLFFTTFTATRGPMPSSFSFSPPACVRADDLLFLLPRTNAANVETHRRIELERLTTSGRLGIAEHDPDLL